MIPCRLTEPRKSVSGAPGLARPVRAARETAASRFDGAEARSRTPTATARAALSLNKPKLDNLAGNIWKSAHRLRGKFKATNIGASSCPSSSSVGWSAVLLAWREAKRAEVLAKRPKLTEKELGISPSTTLRAEHNKEPGDRLPEPEFRFDLCCRIRHPASARSQLSKISLPAASNCTQTTY